MIVYRLEKNGTGPYRYTDYNKATPEEDELIDLIKELCNEHKNHDIWPTGRCDCLTDIFRDYRYGFSCTADLEDWFGEFLPPLLELGFEIVEYEAKFYKFGNSMKQLVFDVENSYRINHEPKSCHHSSKAVLC